MISRNQKRLLIAILLFPWTVAVAAELISVGSNGGQGNRSSEYPSISADGRFVAFASYATNLVAGVTTTTRNVFVYDRRKNTIELISMNNNKVEGNDYSEYPSISADGRFVAFQSDATNLVTGITTTGRNIFVRDRTQKTIELISVNSNGVGANNSSWYPSISADGGFVAFESIATNLVDDDTNDDYDVFVHDRSKKTTERVSIADGGDEGDGDSRNPSISADGHFVAFESIATNLVNGDTNHQKDIFVHDRSKQTTVRASIADDGRQGNEGSINPSISADGRFVLFSSNATNLVAGGSSSGSHIFIHDLTARTTEQVTVGFSGNQPDDSSYIPSISADGRFVVFESTATNLVDDDNNQSRDIFVYDRTTKTIERVSIADDGSESNGASMNPSISADGRVVVFDSEATNLVAGGTTGRHVYLARHLVRNSAESVPAMGVGVLIVLISLVGGMTLRMRARSRR